MHGPKDRVIQVLASTSYHIQRAIELMDNSGLVLYPADAREAADSLLRHLETYSWLATCMWQERRQLFLMRPKHHCLWHLSLQVRHWRLNLCMFHCFDEESFLGKVKAICQKTHGKTATKRTFQRYTLCLAMLMSNTDASLQGLERLYI